MTAGAALRAALSDGYRQSWRLVALNAVVGLVVAAGVLGAMFFLPAALLVVVAGPVVAALAHCAVVLADTGDLDWADAAEGLRRHWRRGLALGALDAAGIGIGLLALYFYTSRGLWPVAAVTAYLLAAFLFWQLVAWPLAVAAPTLTAALARAGRELLRRPGSALALGLALLAVNAAGAAAVMPLLTLTLAYSLLAAAHFVRSDDSEGARRWQT
jgi:hypothetical protein